MFSVALIWFNFGSTYAWAFPYGLHVCENIDNEDDLTGHGAKLRNLLVKKRCVVSPVNVVFSVQEQLWQWSFVFIHKASNLLVVSPTSL